MDSKLLRKKAEHAMKLHMQSVEHWKEGNVLDVWTDYDGILCIKYESGNWWHYRSVKGAIEWW